MRLDCTAPLTSPCASEPTFVVKADLRKIEGKLGASHSRHDVQCVTLAGVLLGGGDGSTPLVIKSLTPVCLSALCRSCHACVNRQRLRVIDPLCFCGGFCDDSRAHDQWQLNRNLVRLSHTRGLLLASHTCRAVRLRLTGDCVPGTAYLRCERVILARR